MFEELLNRIAAALDAADIRYTIIGGQGVLFSLSAYKSEALDRAKHITLGALEIRDVSVEDLIIHKAISGRPRDWEDIDSVVTKSPQTNISFIEKQLTFFEKTLDHPCWTPCANFSKNRN